MKYIKEFRHHRDYDYIKDRLRTLYEISVSDSDLKLFEESSEYNDNYSDSEYVTKYVLYNMSESITEDIGVGTIAMGTLSGMGPVVGTSPSSVPGQTTNASGFSTPVAGDPFGDGGVVGSGDIGSGWATSISNNKNIRKRDTHLPRSRRKNKAEAALKAMRAKKSTQFTVKPNNEVDFKKSTGVKSFTDFFK